MTPHRQLKVETVLQYRIPQLVQPGSSHPHGLRVDAVRDRPPPQADGRPEALRCLTATVTVSPGAPEPECRTLFPNISLTSKAASSPHGCPGPSTALTNARATRACSARPSSVTVSRSTRPPISAPPSLPPAPRETTRATGWTHLDARPIRPRTSSPDTPPSRAPEPRQAATHTAPRSGFPSAYLHASAVGLWQTGLYDQVARLECACGGPLVNRRRPAGTPILTPLGQLLCHQARDYQLPADSSR